MGATDRQRATEQFLERVLRIERDLGELEGLAYDISRMYGGDAFPEQAKLSADMLENLMIAATHEAASHIGLCRNDIEDLIRYIEFRERHGGLSDGDISKVLEGGVSPSPLEPSGGLSGQPPAEVGAAARDDELVRDWHDAFGGRSYSKVKRQLRI
ncbi:MAG: hypothetical protein FWH47_06380 [Methanomassiliicoccaceae archaeon]|nr:hypothetical protein [Methanomassiliicoccaceae archaeon]